MSNKSKERIKGLRSVAQCFTIDGSVKNIMDPMYPFGTDGDLVDMLSQLDLEEELKLGGSHWTQIEDNVDEDHNIDQTIIKEWYFTGSIDSQTDKDSCSYSLVTTINNRNLEVYLDVGDKEQTTGQAYDVYLNASEEGQLPIHIITVQDNDFEPKSVISIELYNTNFEQQDVHYLWKKEIILKADMVWNYEIKDWEYEQNWNDTMEGYEDHRTPIYWTEEDEGYEDHRTGMPKYSIIESLSQYSEQESEQGEEEEEG